MMDKVKRLVTFCRGGVLRVKDEGPRDALMDILNYVILMAAYIKCRGLLVDARREARFKVIDPLQARSDRAGATVTSPEPENTAPDVHKMEATCRVLSMVPFGALLI
jgi:hypothetical protein